MSRAKKTVKRLHNLGTYSVAVLIPKRWIVDMGAVRSGAVEMAYDEENKVITVSNIKPLR